MPIVIDAFRLYAVAGLTLSLFVHLASWLGYQPGGDAMFFALHIGIFPLWIFAMFATKSLFAGAGRRDHWNLMLSGCPPWLQIVTRGFFYYAIVNFIIFFAQSILTGGTGKLPPGAPPPASVWHGFSGHWMLFYCAGFAMLTTARRVGWDRMARKCPRGHAVSWSDAYCPDCGVKLPEISPTDISNGKVGSRTSSR